MQMSTVATTTGPMNKMNTDTITIDSLRTPSQKPSEQEFEEHWEKTAHGRYVNIWMDLPGSQFVSDVLPMAVNKEQYKKAFLANQISYYPVYDMKKEGTEGHIYKVKKGGKNVYIKAYFKHSSALEEESTNNEIERRFRAKRLLAHMPALGSKFVYNQAILKEKKRLVENEKMRDIKEVTYQICLDAEAPKWLHEYVKIAPRNPSSNIQSSVLLYSPESVYHPGDWLFECISAHQKEESHARNDNDSIHHAVQQALGSERVKTLKQITANSFDATYIKNELTRISSWSEIDWHEGGALSDRLADGKLQQEELPSIVCSLAHAIYALQLCKISHCDVKPDNVVIDANEKSKFIDAGNAFTDPNKLFKKEMHKQLWGTLMYASPEVWLHADESEQNEVSIGEIIFAKDIWSFGIILLDIWGLCGEGLDSEPTMIHVSKRQWKAYAESIHEDTPAKTIKILERLQILGMGVEVEVEKKEIKRNGKYISRSAAKLILACLQFDPYERQKAFLKIMGPSFRKTLESRSMSPFEDITNLKRRITNAIAKFTPKRHSDELDEPDLKQRKHTL